MTASNLQHEYIAGVIGEDYLLELSSIYMNIHLASLTNDKDIQ